MAARMRHLIEMKYRHYRLPRPPLNPRIDTGISSCRRARALLCEPGHNFLGIPVRREHRIEYLRDGAAVDHPGHTFEQGHAVENERRKTEREREREVGVGEDREQ